MLLQVSFLLPSTATASFANLLRTLDTKQTELGVAGYGLSCATLEEVRAYWNCFNRVVRVLTDRSYRLKGDPFVASAAAKCCSLSTPHRRSCLSKKLFPPSRPSSLLWLVLRPRLRYLLLLVPHSGLFKVISTWLLFESLPVAHGHTFWAPVL